VWHERVLAAMGRGEAVAWAIVVAGRVVGGTTYHEFSVADCRLEIGNTWHAPAVWRTAVNTECKLLLLRQAFETLGANRVQLKTDARNVRSQTAIARLGAQREGTLRAHMVMPDGFVRDSVMFSIVRAEWPGVRARLEERLARG
jgi:RimJ/RimL family protein N-acetyltransferase